MAGVRHFGGETPDAAPPDRLSVADSDVFQVIAGLAGYNDRAVLTADVTANSTTSAPITAMEFSNFPDFMVIPLIMSVSPKRLV